MSSCSFNNGGTSSTVFCQNGCCASQCCDDGFVDTNALAIALAVILAFIILLILLALLVYCCIRRKKRRKGEWRDNLVTTRNDVVPLSSMHGKRRYSSSSSSSSSSASSHNTHKYPPPVHSTPLYDQREPVGGYTSSKLVQTTDHNPTVKDKILGGRSRRWQSHVRKRGTGRNSSISHFANPNEIGTQTSIFDTPHTGPPSSYYQDDLHMHTDRPTQSQATGRTSSVDRNARGRSKGSRVADQAAKNPYRSGWQPAKQHKTLSTTSPKRTRN